MQNQKKIKLSNYFGYVQKAAVYYQQKNYTESLLFFRKSGEAFMKYRLYDKLDERKVQNYLVGSHSLDGKLNKKNFRPTYSNILHELDKLGCLSEDEKMALCHLSSGSNVQMHDPDEEKTELDKNIDFSLVFDHSRKLTQLFYKSMLKGIPQKLKDAYEGKSPLDRMAVPI